MKVVKIPEAVRRPRLALTVFTSIKGANATQELNHADASGKVETGASRARRSRRRPWRLPLERVHGKIGDDGIERITTQLLFDILEVPQRSRGAGACRRLAKLMAELGWMAVRVRGLTRGGYLEQVQGYCRDARQRRHPRGPDQQHAPAGGAYVLFGKDHAISDPGSALGLFHQLGFPAYRQGYDPLRGTYLDNVAQY